ncbi:DUF4332 domain-containing protein [Aporhodopirellula aestuarii]|uniref:DUF4332 domain-containing protein n=1 Tax=Aporhodopirellula aestuarii TaxID=2950107 RepID=A0ABT0U4Y6_9BACT|nr:DUF4332 domain-containing protein [Aporhodopirellula aestuarii]MCM2371990.1 DUF4332 domain-containing protein [Aporhodopirellula aestuarii]
MTKTSTNLLLSILRAAHCRSTHHHFAIDAIPLVGTPAGERFVGHLLRHHHRYLAGAKDPDVRFRDFQNHVIHVDDGYWGGAPRVAHQWYDRLQRYMRTNRWSDAAHAAGVLSHYFTDPIQPLHTAQTPVEKVLHRPIEWSVTKSYPALFAQWQNDPSRIVFQLSDSPGWLGEAILSSARVAHQHYETLLNHYDLKAGRSNPPAGLDSVSRGCLAQLIGLCVTGWARVIERAALEAESSRNQPIPQQGTTLAIVLAGIRTPHQHWIRRIEHKIEQKKITALIDEFEATGTLSKNLPSELRVMEKVRHIYTKEREYNRLRAERQTGSTIQILQEGDADVKKINKPTIQATATPQRDETDSAPITIPFVSPQSENVRLRVEDPLVDAPSIGSKTAARFAKLGIHSVGDFLAADPVDLAAKLATRWITHDTLRAWRCQAILMCQLPDMLARETQLLVGSGFTTADSIAKSNVEALSQAIQEYASTYSGRRYLRGAEPPDRDRIDTWIGEAALAMVRQKRAVARMNTVNSDPAQNQSSRAA